MQLNNLSFNCTDRERMKENYSYSCGTELALEEGQQLEIIERAEGILKF